jgi:bacterioferritin-associated ferredoxin
MYICICNAITERQIRACAEQGVCTLSELECQLGVGIGCGRCRQAANDVLNENRSKPQTVLSGTFG